MTTHTQSQRTQWPKITEADEAPVGIPKALVCTVYAIQRIGLPACMLIFLAWRMVVTDNQHREDWKEQNAAVSAQNHEFNASINRLSDEIHAVLTMRGYRGEVTQ